MYQQAFFLKSFVTCYSIYYTEAPNVVYALPNYWAQQVRLHVKDPINDHGLSFSVVAKGVFDKRLDGISLSECNLMDGQPDTFLILVDHINLQYQTAGVA